ncbi:MAG TPA: DUF6798 domain-containing protein [Bryobacteraceae bacterium]|nr:DUF6798 domain-containing protein [Bryobacteraceae bacterium]
MKPAHLFALVALTIGAVMVHGYHPAAEDAEVYLPSVLRLLDPSLYPHDAAFALAHARLTLFPYLVAGSIRLSHLPIGMALLAWHLAGIFLLLWACHRIARLCFRESPAVWGGVALVAALLTIPVAGTALYIMDQYLTARSLATPGAILALATALEGKRGQAMLWALFTAAVHPLMGVLAGALWGCYELVRVRRSTALAGVVLLAPITPAYEEVLKKLPYHMITKWAWYEWIGAVAPLAILGWLGRHRPGPIQTLSRALVIFQAIFLAAGLTVCLPGLASLSRTQPMRSLHFVYILMFLFIGGLLGEQVLKRHAWRWALLLVPLCGGMWYAQRQLFPATPHLEWPWMESPNPWVRAFQWIRTNTPKDALFALDPDYMSLPGEDHQGFRVLAQRSRLADAAKDSGPASLMPELAEEWVAQVEAQRDMARFQASDFQMLSDKYGVSWVLLRHAPPQGLACPYQQDGLSVCRIER